MNIPKMKNTKNIIYQSIWSDIKDENEFPYKTPLLAHYTSMDNFDLIVDGEEFWFSNPLNMNDSEELTFGMIQGASEFKANENLKKACENEDVLCQLMSAFDDHYNHFDENHAFDTYIICFSEHDDENYDGSLSMWRGYGANGNGVSLVIDTKKIVAEETTPLIISPVEYATREERINWIKEQTNQIAILLTNIDKSNETLNYIAYQWVERLKVYSLFTKHTGFQEEKEWRFVYLNDRDSDSSYKSMFGYSISDERIEPRLKLKFGKIPGENASLTLESLIDRIILGPATSSVLSKMSVIRMLEIKGKPELVEKVHASSIPYRS
jgi:hypothetical protein